MNLIFRAIYVLILSLFRYRISPDNLLSGLSLRVISNDLDINLHMDNGCYLTICDMNRVDLFIRSGLMKTMFKRGWISLSAENTMTYKKPLNLFKRFNVSLQMTCWDGKYFMRHILSKLQNKLWQKECQKFLSILVVSVWSVLLMCLRQWKRIK